MWAWVLGLVLQGAVGRAEALWDAGQRSEAIAVWREDVARAPADRALLRRLAEAELAVHQYTAALEHASGLGAELDGLRGTALHRLGEFERALGHLRRDEAAQLEMRIDCAEALARFEEAEREVEALVALVGEGDARVPTLRGRCAARRGDVAAAERWFRRALELDAADPAALFGLGQLLAKRGQREEALRLLAEHRRVTPLLDALDFARRSIDLAPSHGPNYAALGDAERALGRFEAAQRSFERASELAEPAQLAPIALRSARLLHEDLGRAEQAVAVLDAAFERCGDVRLLVRAGDVLAAAGRRADALKRFEAALKLRPDDAEIERRARAVRDGEGERR